MGIPPLGIKPKFIWDSMRIQDILDAMERFADAQKPVPVEWVTELRDLLVRKGEADKYTKEHEDGSY